MYRNDRFRKLHNGVGNMQQFVLIVQIVRGCINFHDVKGSFKLKGIRNIARWNKKIKIKIFEFTNAS